MIHAKVYSIIAPDGWSIAIIFFLIMVILSGIIMAYITKPKFKVNSAGMNADNPFEKAKFLDDELIEWLSNHYLSLSPVLEVWQKMVWKYKSIHYYVVGWTTVIALLIPFLIPYTGDSTNARYLVQIASAYAAVIYSLHSVFKVQNNFQKYRLHESSVYSIIREIIDDPDSFDDPNVELNNTKKSNKNIYNTYVKRINDIRDRARNDEIDNIPVPTAPVESRKI